MKTTFDQQADAVYVLVTDEPVAYTDIIDDERFVHYTEAGAIRGFEFLDVSHGVNLLGLPITGCDVGGELQRLGIKLTNPIHISAPGSIGRSPISAVLVGDIGFTPQFIQLLDVADEERETPPVVIFAPVPSGEVSLPLVYA